MKTYLGWQIHLFNGSNTLELPLLKLINIITLQKLFVPVENYKNIVRYKAVQMLLSKQVGQQDKRKGRNETT